MTESRRMVKVDVSDDDLNFAENMESEGEQDQTSAEVDGDYDYFADDLAYDTARERGYR